LRRAVVVVVVVTGGEQSGNEGITYGVYREITQGLQEGHGVDKGITVAATCVFYDFETSEGIDFSSLSVRCMAS
jgi:hypothetical protein